MKHFRGFVLWAVALTLVTLLCHFDTASAQTLTPAQQQARAAAAAAEKAALAAATHGPAKIPLLDEATLDLPTGYFFVPQKEATELMNSVGHRSSRPIAGLVGTEAQNKRWIILIEYNKSGYVKDEDAQHWNADDLLKKIQDGTLAGNADRTEKGFPALEVSGWVETPVYNAPSHQLVWSVLVKRIGEPNSDPSVNYNTYALGRDGFFSLDLITKNSAIAEDKTNAHEILADLHYDAGKGYEDFAQGTDKVAEFGLAALITGVVAKKLGLFAIILAFVVKFIKIIIIASAAFFAGVRKKLGGLLGRKPKVDALGQPLNQEDTTPKPPQ